jgi:hypothetical protein
MHTLSLLGVWVGLVKNLKATDPAEDLDGQRLLLLLPMDGLQRDVVISKVITMLTR